MPDIAAGWQDAFLLSCSPILRRLRPSEFRRAWARAMAVDLSRVSLRLRGGHPRHLADDGQRDQALAFEDAIEGRALRFPAARLAGADALAIEGLRNRSHGEPSSVESADARTAACSSGVGTSWRRPLGWPRLTTAVP